MIEGLGCLKAQAQVHTYVIPTLYSGRFFILIGVLVLYALATLQYITSNEVIVNKAKKSLLVAIKSGKKMTFPYQEELAKEQRLA